MALLLSKKNVQLKQHKGFTVFDIETNGLETSTQILEIAAIKVKEVPFVPDEKTMSVFKYLVYFDGPLNKAAQSVHNIDSRMLKKEGRPLSEVLSGFIEFAHDTVLVGHNITQFDLRVLSYHLERHNLSLKSSGVMDTRFLAQKLVNLPNYRLSTLCAYFNVENMPTHRAFADVLSTAEVFQRLYALL